MARTTISRDWTADEETLADQIVDVVAAADRLLGTWQVVRGCGLPVDHRSRRLVWDVMPLAVIRAKARHPGKALVVGRDHTYMLTDDTHRTMQQLVTLVKQERTRAERAAALSGPLGADTSLAAAVIRERLHDMLRATDPAIWDAIVGEVETPSSGGGT